MQRLGIATAQTVVTTEVCWRPVPPTGFQEPTQTCVFGKTEGRQKIDKPPCGGLFCSGWSAANLTICRSLAGSPNVL